MRPIVLGIGAAAAALAAVLVASTASAARTAPLALWRSKLLGCAQGHVAARTPYEWGGGHGRPGYGLDCSGLVLQCAAEAGVEIWQNADGMYKQLPSVDQPQPGDLALYGQPQRATHVRIVERWIPSEGRAECIGEENGSSSTTTPEIAMMQRAYAKRVADHRTRRDFLGFRTLEQRPRTPAGASSSPRLSPPG